MALFEYQCHTCEHIFEKLHRIEDRKIPETEPCPNCGAMNVQQHIFTAQRWIDAHKIGVKKVDDGFREILARASQSAGSDLKDKLSRNP